MYFKERLLRWEGRFEATVLQILLTLGSTTGGPVVSLSEPPASGLSSILLRILYFLRPFLVGLVLVHLVDMLFLAPKRIKNIPNVFSGIPIWGSLGLLFPPATKWQDSPCLKLAQLAERYGPVYQVRMGTKLVVVANSYESVMKLWTGKNGRGNNSRVATNTFHNVLSRDGIFTVGSTPFGPEYLRMRKFISMNVLNAARAHSLNGRVISRETDKLLARLMEGFEEGDTIVTDLTRQCQYFHLAVALTITYGYRINYEYPESVAEADEVIYVENQITKIRSHVQNVQDFLPWPLAQVFNACTRNNERAVDYYDRRRAYLTKYLKYVRSKVTYPTSAVAQSLMYRYFMDGETTVSNTEMASVCLTMVSAGLDNMPLNFKYEMHQLSHSPHIVKKSLEELDHWYGSREAAFSNCTDMKCEYIMAVVNETLRLFTVLPMALPRLTTSPLIYKNAAIPEGSVLYMNCYAANHDPAVFYKPDEFIPERFIDNHDIHHVAFGIGSRMCLGNRLALQELYVLTVKFLLAFEFQRPTVSKLPALQLNRFPESIAIEPVSFGIPLKIRSGALGLLRPVA